MTPRNTSGGETLGPLQGSGYASDADARLTLPQRRQEPAGKLFSSPNFEKLSRRQTVCTVSFPSLASSLSLRQMETSHQSRGLRKRSIRQVPGYARLQMRHETAVGKSRLNTKYSDGQRNSGSGCLITGRLAEPRQRERRGGVGGWGGAPSTKKMRRKTSPYGQTAAAAASDVR